MAYGILICTPAILAVWAIAWWALKPITDKVSEGDDFEPPNPRQP